MVAGDRYKVPPDYSYQSAPLGGRRDAEGRKEGQCPAQEDAYDKGSCDVTSKSTIAEG